ncbi:hypothetical protein [Paramagnetospirillum marisnigri]|nr:hypothetical protein [Paramagnetospirillum marisnigri]
MSRFEQAPPDESEQRRFERAVMAVMYRVCVTGERIDQAAQDYATNSQFGLLRDHLLADMIICASDCLRALAPRQGNARPAPDSVLALFGRWLGRGGMDESWHGGERTRIQDCIRNLRRAESGADVGNP